jgi:uncharacterized membrane protein YheB (UPF0754 family)
MDFFSWFFHSFFTGGFWFQPAFYALHGWLATEMALWMLFHPYEPTYLPGTKIKLPFTPGIFPRGRHKLSISIANTITEILLTREDIKNQAEKLITEPNILVTLDALFNSVGAELKDITHIQRIRRYIEGLIPPLFQKLLNDYIVELENGKSVQFKATVGQLLNRTLPYLKLNEAQAEFVAHTVFEKCVTPANIRKVLLDLLTVENMDRLDEGIRGHIGGLQGFLFRFFDLKKGFYQFRIFLSDQPDEAEAMISQVLAHLALEAKLREALLNFSLQQLPVEDLEAVKVFIADVAIDFLIGNRESVTQTVYTWSEEATHSITHSLIHIDYTQVAENWLPGFKRDLAHFVYTYLNQELENMVSHALPIISLNTVIVEKIDQFSAKELEETIQRICHRELRCLAFLGAFLGLWLGMVSNIINYWIHPLSR